MPAILAVEPGWPKPAQKNAGETDIQLLLCSHQNVHHAPAIQYCARVAGGNSVTRAEHILIYWAVFAFGGGKWAAGHSQRTSSAGNASRIAVR